MEKNKTFNWAITQLREGKKVRRPMWAEDSYWVLGVDEKIEWHNEYRYDNATVHLNQLEATDWEIYRPTFDDIEFFVDNKPVMKLSENGNIYIRNRLIWNDKEVVKGMRYLLLGVKQ